MGRAKQTATRPSSGKSPTKKEAGAKAPASSVSDSNAQAQLDGFIDRFSPEIAALGRAVLAHMRKRLPGAVCLVYDNYNALVVGFGPDATVKNAPFSVAFYPRWINLFLLRGGRLHDPHGLLRGSGPLVRNVKISSVADLKDGRLEDLITAATRESGWLLNPGGKNQLMIRSISPKQRPRRA